MVSARRSLGERLEWLETDRGPAVLKLGGYTGAGSAELALYERVLEPERDGSPRLLAASRADGWLLLEGIAGRLAELADADDVTAVYARLGALHAAHAGRPPGQALGPLSAPDAPAIIDGVQALTELVERASHDAEAWEIGPGERDRCRSLLGWAGEAGPALAAGGPVTLLHGDFQRRNWLIAPGGARILDWELAARGPGILDLYYLSSDGPGAGHAPSGSMAAIALDVWCAAAGADVDRSRSLLPHAIAWGAIAGARQRLSDFYGLAARGRTPRGELPGAARSLIAYAAARISP